MWIIPDPGPLPRILPDIPDEEVYDDEDDDDYDDDDY